MSSNDDLILTDNSWSSGLGLTIDPNAPEAGVCSYQSSTGGSLLGGGVWQNISAQSLLTKGFITKSDNPNCFFGVIETQHAPLTKGYGDAQLAGPEDVEVIVNDAFREVLTVLPTRGLIILKNPVEVGAEVLISYFYTSNPTFEFNEFNNSGYLFNQAGTSYLYQKHPFSTVFGPRDGNTQPVEKGHTHTAYQRGYTAVFNDPTVMLFNEPVWSSGLPSLKRNLKEVSLSFEGTQLPTEEGWEIKGTLPSTPEFEEDLFLIDDIYSSQNVIDSEPLFYYNDVDLSYDHITLANFRLKVFDYQALGDFTGVSAGYASDTTLFLLGFLEVDGFTFSGFLSKNEENLWTSYLGLTSIVNPREDENDNSVNDRLVFDFEVSLERNDLLFLDNEVYEVEDSFLEDNQFHVILTSEVPISLIGTTQQVFPEIKYQDLISYRIFKNEDGAIQAFQGGQTVPFAQANEENLASGTEIFETIEQNTVFFGSISRQAESKTGWEFLRFDLLPTSPLDSSKKISVRSDFNELPEQHSDHPWTLIDDQGYSQITNEGLLLEQAGRTSEGSFSYGRVEPLFTSQTTIDFRTSLRVDSYSTGVAASFTLADERKEVTIGLFSEEDLPSVLADTSLFKITGGQVDLIDPITLATSGGIPPEGAFLESSPIPSFRASYSGTKSFLDEGWIEENFESIESSFLDRWHHIKKEGGTGNISKAFIDIPIPDPNEPFTQHLFSTRIRIKEGVLNTNNLLPVRIGIDDNDRFISLGFWDDGNEKKIVFVDQNGEPIEDPLDIGEPLGQNFNWDDYNFHTYRVLRNQTSFLLYIDGEHQRTFNAPIFPGTENSKDSYELSLLIDDGDIEFDLNYFFAHSLRYGDRKVGLFLGGDINDPSSYEFIDGDWFGNELEIRVHRNPEGKTQVFLGGDQDPSFVKQYSELPARGSSFQLNTNLGYIRFGHLDPRSFTHSLWEFIEYQIQNERENLIPLKGSRFNRAHVVSSPEGVYDESPDLVKVYSDTKTKIVLSSKGLGATRVLDVLSLDEQLYYAFNFNKKSQEIDLLDEAPSPRTPLKIRYLADKPYGMKYLQNQDPITKLNEGTPPFPKTLQKRLTVVEDIVDPDTDLFNGIEETSFNDGKFRLTFTVNDDAFYESLDLESFELRGDRRLISPACDELGWKELLFDEWDDLKDTYEIPNQATEGAGNYNQMFRLEEESSILDSIEFVLEPFSDSDIELGLEWLQEEDPYTGATDAGEPFEAEIVEVSGFLLDVSSSLLDSEDDLLDTWDESPVISGLENLNVEFSP